MLARCVRVVPTHARALYSTVPPTDSQKPMFNAISTLIDAIEHSKPPVGTQYPAPKHPSPKLNPLDMDIVASFATKVPRYSLYCQSTRNNTITTLMTDDFHPVAAFSGGSCGFKKVNRSSYEAGYQCAVRIFKRIAELKEHTHFEIDLYFKGFGQGRDAMHKALLTSEGDNVRKLVRSVTDRTPIKIGGTRSKKARRL
ncbi:hypothetical protein C0989_000014 [Termitomyces sp. Mn162]|nr:hypothetical protein C0989_000014 [Termitomyces sp. Mn162]KAH0587424.1 hypothetical protein H2248_006213 [Termitomyces sp. 'cryptogamus']